MLRSCTLTGAKNCDKNIFDEGVEARKSGIYGDINGGRLKDANIVRLSRTPKRARDVFGMVFWIGLGRFEAGDVVDDGGVDLAGLLFCAPKIFAKRESL